jgi:hypothetical protein
MKKQNLKNLSLNKKSVSNLTPGVIKGGGDTVAPLRCTYYYTDLGCSLQGDCGSDTCGISCLGGSECHCL